MQLASSGEWWYRYLKIAVTLIFDYGYPLQIDQEYFTTLLFQNIYILLFLCSDAEILTPLAYKFEIKPLLSKCENLLIDEFCKNLEKRMPYTILAETCKLSELQEYAIEEFSRINTTALQKKIAYDDLSNEIKLEIYFRRAKNLENQVCLAIK